MALTELCELRTSSTAVLGVNQTSLGACGRRERLMCFPGRACCLGMPHRILINACIRHAPHTDLIHCTDTQEDMAPLTTRLIKLASIQHLVEKDTYNTLSRQA